MIILQSQIVSLHLVLRVETEIKRVKNKYLQVNNIYMDSQYKIFDK